MAVLLLLTQRPGAQSLWGVHAAVTQLALPPLRAEESQAIVAAVPGTAQLPVARRQEILAHGAGNPFFLEELAWDAVLFRLAGDHDGAMADGQQALALAAECGESALQVQASYSLGVAYHAIGDFGRAAELLRRNVEA